MKEEIIEVVRQIPQERVPNCTVEQIDFVPVPGIRAEIGQVIQPIMREGISDRAGEQIIGVLVPETGEHSVEVVKVPDERVMEERRGHILEECTKLQKFEARLGEMDEAMVRVTERQPHRSQQQASQRKEEQKETGKGAGKEEEKEKKEEKEGKEEKEKKEEKEGKEEKEEKEKKEEKEEKEESSKVKVRDVARGVLRTGESDQDVYVTSEGRMLEGSEELGSCGVRDGSTVQVVRKLRGGGRSKGKMPSGGKRKTSPKKVEQSDQSTTEKSSLEVDVVSEMFDDGSRRMERGDDGGDAGDGRRADGENVEDVKKQLRGKKQR